MTIDWSQLSNEVATVNHQPPPARNVKAIPVADREKYEADGWVFERALNDERVVMSRLEAPTPRRKSKCGAFVDIDPAGQWFVLRTPYDADFVDELKARIDYADRKWDRDLKAWKVGPGGWRDAAELLKKHYGEDNVHYTPASETKLTELMEDELDSPDLFAYAAIGVRSDAPMVVIHAAYEAIEAFYLPSKTDDPNRIQMPPVDVPTLESARDAYLRILKHRKTTPDAEVSTRVYMSQYLRALEHEAQRKQKGKKK